MPQSFSLDLLGSALAGCGLCRGAPFLPPATRRFGVNDSCAISLMQRQRHSSSLAAARQGRTPTRAASWRPIKLSCSKQLRQSYPLPCLNSPQSCCSSTGWRRPP